MSDTKDPPPPTLASNVDHRGLAEELAGLGHWYLTLGADRPQWSAEVFRIHGRDPALGEPLLADAFAYYHPEDVPKVQAAVEKAIETKTGFDFEHRLIGEDGRERVVHSRARVEVVDGVVVGLAGVFEDISDDYRHKQSVDRMSVLHRAIVKSATESIIATDLEGTIVLFSGGAERMLGYSPEEVVGKHTPALIHVVDEVVARAESLSHEVGETVEPGFEVFVYHARRGRSETREWSYQRKDGTRLTVSLSVAGLYDDEGNLTGFLGTAHDVTELRQAMRALETSQAKLEDQSRKAEAASRSKSEFLAVMSHELRTPMTGVLGMVDLLRETVLSEDQKSFIDALGTSARDLLELLNDILDLSKLEAGHIEIEAANFRLEDVLASVRDIFGTRASSKGVALSIDIPVLVPRALLGDSTRLRQVLFNLIGNAVKFTERGTIDVVIGCEADPNGAMLLRVEVRDSGIGMTQAQSERIFDSFVQADSSTSRRFGGTGLGLAICKKIVEAAGGSIGVDSVPGEGSTFWFTMPVDHARPELPVAQPLNAGPSAVAASEVPPLSVLVVEDTPVNQLLIGQMLGRRGHDVTYAGDGKEAIETIESRPDQPFDVVLMDMQMPVMDGPTATRELRRRGWSSDRLPIVALTADAVPEHRAVYEQAGLDAFLTKPIQWPALVNTLAEQHRRVAAANAGADGPAAPASIRANAGASSDRDDEYAFDNLVSMLGADAAIDLIRMLPRELASMVSRIDVAATEGDDGQVSRVAHQLKSVAAYIGAERLRDQCKQLERDPQLATEQARRTLALDIDRLTEAGDAYVRGHQAAA